MPLPIQSLNNFPEDNDNVQMSSLGLSDIQIQLLGLSKPTREAKVIVSQKHIDLLKEIEKNQNDVVTAANMLNNIKDAKVCNVPKSIHDNDLLALKTAGLLTGSGRAVTLTEKGRVALRDAYLKDPVNEFKKARKKEKFDLTEAQNVKVASKKSTFKKIWLTDDFKGEFDLRLIADNDKLLQKGLMHSEPLEDFEVAYFIFPSKGKHSFWNKNVSYPLTLAFLNSDHEIVDFKDMEAEQTKSVSPDSNFVKYVVEANKDTFKELGIKVGDKLEYKDNKIVFRKSN